MHKLLTVSFLVLLEEAARSSPSRKSPWPQPRPRRSSAWRAGVKSAELEMEKGKPVYLFDFVTADKKIMEVRIDAMTGDAIEGEEETPEHEREEEKQDRKTRQGSAKQWVMPLARIVMRIIGSR